MSWLDDLAWTSGDGPRALFCAAVVWQRQRRVLLPGFTTLTELVAEVRTAAEDRLQATLSGCVTAGHARVQEAAPPAGADPHGAWRAGIVERYAAVRGLVKMLCQVIEFGATTDARPVLAAMAALPDLLDARPTRRVPAG
jgi:hypothetical protein